MTPKKVFSLRFFLLLACLFIVIQGCATKGFVEQRVIPLETKIADISSQVEGLRMEDNRISEELVRLDKKGIVKKVITSHSIMFDFDRWQLKDQSKEILTQIAQQLVSGKNLAAFVVGHTDDIGLEGYNLLLGQRRAQMVASYLLAEPGILPYKVYVESLGELLPKVPNNSHDGRSLNRRVEIILVETNLL